MPMRTVAGPFDALVACLRGRPPAGADWMGIIAEANRYLVTPALHKALEGGKGFVPQDALDYLTFLYSRNHERNARLRAEAIQVVEEMNRRGICPIPLKGASTLLTAENDELGIRIMADLDLMVPAKQIATAMECLSDLGYRAFPKGAGPHAHATLGRAGNIAPIDLHHRPPGPEHLHCLKELEKNCTLVAVGNGRIRLPSATYQAFHLIVHDLLHEGHFQTGDMDLRHLLDLDKLSRRDPGIDWSQLASMMSGTRERQALEAQLVTLSRLFGTDIPHRLRVAPLAWVQYRRRLLQAQRPALVHSRPYKMAQQMARLAWQTVYRQATPRE